mgnify:CR=1 FL=1
MARFLPRPSTAGVGAVTASGWFLMVEFLAASQAVFQKGQFFATDKLIKLGSLVERCQPKEWYGKKGEYGCTVPSEASSNAVQLKSAIDTATPGISTEIHNFMARNLPEGLLEPVTATMQGLVSDMHAKGVADVATQLDLASLQARLALRCGKFIDVPGTVCGTTNEAIVPLMNNVGSLGSGSPQELFSYGLAAVLTLIAGAAVTASRRRAVTQPAPVLVAAAPTAPLPPAAAAQPAAVPQAA